MAEELLNVKKKKKEKKDGPEVIQGVKTHKDTIPALSFSSSSQHLDAWGAQVEEAEEGALNFMILSHTVQEKLWSC